MELDDSRENNIKTESLVSNLATLQDHDPNPQLFRQIETALNEAGFELANSSDVQNILHDNSLFCRSVDFSDAIDSVGQDVDIQITNASESANMCTVSGGGGFRTAMTEGFSGNEVNFNVKTVITFEPNHITERAGVPKENDLWRTKPKTAEVSVIGNGSITPGDIIMISLRFPIHLYPAGLMSDNELERLEEEKIKFIVRHYINKKTAH